MEALLGELHSASKLLGDFREMYEYENRLKTFTNWPFQGNCKCAPENMAKAGFIHCSNVNESDMAKCFFCLLELEGWEQNDDPWEEHTKHHICAFLSLPKSLEDLTMEDYYMLEMTRLRTVICKIGRRVINSFEEEVAKTRKHLVDYFVSKHQYTPPLPLGDDPSTQHSEGSYCQSKKDQEKWKCQV